MQIILGLKNCAIFPAFSKSVQPFVVGAKISCLQIHGHFDTGRKENIFLMYAFLVNVCLLNLGPVKLDFFYVGKNGGRKE